MIVLDYKTQKSRPCDLQPAAGYYVDFDYVNVLIIYLGSNYQTLYFFQSFSPFWTYLQ